MLSQTVRREAPLALAIALVGFILGGLLVGFEPVGGDPDRLYRPLKSELARALAAGRLPFWSERFGMGVPLVAESQVAAFYPPNLLLYRVLDVPLAYRRSMWLHYVALVVTTYSYARCLGLFPWGSALAGVAFTLCGFQAIHSSHEPFYCLMPYLPLALLISEQYMASGRIIWLALLALCLGMQWTLGHFQIQSWTGGLVMLAGIWRTTFDGRPWRRVFGLVAATGLGAALAAVQLGLSWQFAEIVGQTRRTPREVLYYVFPLGHWFELALPQLTRELKLGPDDPYWFGQLTWGYEASFYVGTIPLIFAFAGAFGGQRKRSTIFWSVLVPVSFTMATIPQWWPPRYLHLLMLPGLGLFRAPARYTLVTSLGLAILAAEGFDRSISETRFRLGLALSCAFGGCALVAAWFWTMRRDVQLSPVLAGIPAGILWAVPAWAVAVAMIVLWRFRRLGAWAPLAAAGLELGILFYLGPTKWGWSIALPAQSPILSALARASPAGSVGGETENLPVRAGLRTAFPYLGFAHTYPNKLLVALQEQASGGDSAALTDRLDAAAYKRWFKRFRLSYLVSSQPFLPSLGQELKPRLDPALDQLVYRAPADPAVRNWTILKLAEPFPEARVAAFARTIADRRNLISRLSRSDDLELAWFLADDRVPPRPDARSARLLSWDGNFAKVEHDGPCDLVVARTYDPGWLARVNDNPEEPVLSVDGGFQAVRIQGSGTARVALRFQPPRLLMWATISLLAAALDLCVLGAAMVRWARSRRITDGARPIG